MTDHIFMMCNYTARDGKVFELHKKYDKFHFDADALNFLISRNYVKEIEASGAGSVSSPDCRTESSGVPSGVSPPLTVDGPQTPLKRGRGRPRKKV